MPSEYQHIKNSMMSIKNCGSKEKLLSDKLMIGRLVKEQMNSNLNVCKNNTKNNNHKKKSQN